MGVYFLHRLTKYGHREMSETQERSLVTDVSVFLFYANGFKRSALRLLLHLFISDL